MNSPYGQQPSGFNQGGASNFYASGITSSQLNGTGSHVQTNKLNRKGLGQNVVVIPGEVQIVDQPIEVIKKVKKQVAVTSAPVVQYRELEPSLRNLIAETQAKVALLVMENNRIKWRIAQHDAEIAKIRGQPVVSTANVVRTHGPMVTTPSVVSTGNVVRTTGPTYGTTTTLPTTTYGATTTAGTVVRRSNTATNGTVYTTGPSTVNTTQIGGGQRVVSSGNTTTIGGPSTYTTTAGTNGAVIRR